MLVDYSDFRNSFTPNNRAGIKFGHLGGDCDLDLDAALIVNFLKLLQSSADHVVSVGLTVECFTREKAPVAPRRAVIESVTN